MARVRLARGTKDLIRAKTLKIDAQIRDDILKPGRVSLASWERAESGIGAPTMERILRAFADYGKLQGAPPLLTQADVHPLLSEVDSKEPNAIDDLSNEAPDYLAMVPFRRNPYFNGRQQVLIELHSLAKSKNHPIISISGLGGIGKTQLAIEYAHRFGVYYSHVFWCPAGSISDLELGYLSIAEDILTECDRSNLQQARQRVKHWLATNHNWLLIMDNADKPAFLESFLPNHVGGQILLTSRDQIFDALGHVKRIDLDQFSEDESISFVMDRTCRKSAETSQREAIANLHHELSGLPLALEQAAAYFVERQLRDFRDYLAEFRTRRLELLRLSPPRAGSYGDSVATTWLLNFKSVKQQSTASADLLRFTAFLADSSPIQFSYIINAESELPDSLASLIAKATVKEVAVADALAPLARFSLVRVEPEQETYSVHALVQEVVRDLDEY